MGIPKSSRDIQDFLDLKFRIFGQDFVLGIGQSSNVNAGMQAVQILMRLVLKSLLLHG